MRAGSGDPLPGCDNASGGQCAKGKLQDAVDFQMAGMGQFRSFGGRRRIGSSAPLPDICWAAQARARLNGFDFSPRLDNGKEFCGILFRADFYVAETIDKAFDEPPLPDRILLHAGEAG
jgi:hypothetical protein